MALVNRDVLLESDVAGPRLWHERKVLEHVPGRFVCCFDTRQRYLC